jgi:DNA/RNA-binding domain of Phe-tRNA-synthetase-like protein
MRYQTISFNVSEDILKHGLRGVYLAIGGLSNRNSDPNFDEFKKEITKEVLANYSPKNIQRDKVLQGFRDLHTSFGFSNRTFVASPENLLENISRTGQLPVVNLLVDIYNTVSIKTRLALGAHDLSKVSGNIHLRITEGKEGYWPLGAPEKKDVRPGAYAYIDDDNDVICMLEVRQVEKTKVSVNTEECFYIIQGNASTDNKYLQLAAEELISLTKKFCGGEERYLYAPWL